MLVASAPPLTQRANSPHGDILAGSTGFILILVHEILLLLNLNLALLNLAALAALVPIGSIVTVSRSLLPMATGELLT